MSPARTGKADEALTGIGLPVIRAMNGVIRSNWQVSETFAGAPIPLPSGNVGSGIGDTRRQLMFDASVSTSRSYSATTRRLYGMVQAVGFIAA